MDAVLAYTAHELRALDGMLSPDAMLTLVKLVKFWQQVGEPWPHSSSQSGRGAGADSCEAGQGCCPLARSACGVGGVIQILNVATLANDDEFMTAVTARGMR